MLHHAATRSTPAGGACRLFSSLPEDAASAVPLKPLVLVTQSFR
jgi:hypothetical protein